MLGQPGESGQGPYSPFPPYTQQRSPPNPDPSGYRNISDPPTMRLGQAGQSLQDSYSSSSPCIQQLLPSNPGPSGYRDISNPQPTIHGQPGESGQGPGFSGPPHRRESSPLAGRHQEGDAGNDGARSRSPPDDPFGHPKPPFDPDEVPSVPICMLMQNCTTGSQLRKAISHIFGRNKMCTRQIPDNVWVHYCRKHYQRVRYRNVQKYAELQIDMVMKQVLRVQAWSRQNVAQDKAGQLTAWQLMARKREQQRLENEASPKGAGCKRTHSQRIAGDHINGNAADAWAEPEPERKKGSTMPNAVPPWLQAKCGQMYQTDQVLEILREIELRIKTEELQQIPDIELLPQLTTDPAEESRQKYKRRSQTIFAPHSRTPSFEMNPSGGGNGIRHHTGYPDAAYAPSGDNGFRSQTGYPNTAYAPTGDNGFRSHAVYPSSGGNGFQSQTGYPNTAYPPSGDNGFRTHTRFPEPVYPSGGGNVFQSQTGYSEAAYPSGGDNGFRHHTGYMDVAHSSGGDNGFRHHTGYSDVAHPSGGDNGFKHHTGYSDVAHPSGGDNGFKHHTGYSDVAHTSGGDNGFRHHTDFPEAAYPSGGGNGVRHHTGYPDPARLPSGNNGFRHHAGYSDAAYPPWRI